MPLGIYQIVEFYILYTYVILEVRLTANVGKTFWLGEHGLKVHIELWAIYKVIYENLREGGHMPQGPPSSSFYAYETLVDCNTICFTHTKVHFRANQNDN